MRSLQVLSRHVRPYRRNAVRRPRMTVRGYKTTAPLWAGKIVKHVPLENNNENMPFEFTEENWEKAKHILTKYPDGYKRSAIMPLLDLAQRQSGGWLPLPAMNKVAKVIGVPPMHVYEVASFYSMYNKNPIGKYFVQVCGTTPCELCGAKEILRTVEEHLGIHSGQTTPDKLFTFLEVECLGACVHAPMMQINDDYYEDLTRESTIKILTNLAEGKPVQPGSQKGRRVSEPFGDRTTLKEPPPGNYAPYLEQLDKVEREKAQQEKQK